MREDATLYSPAEFLTVYFLGTYTSPVAASNLKPRRMAASALFSEAPQTASVAPEMSEPARPTR